MDYIIYSGNIAMLRMGLIYHCMKKNKNELKQLPLGYQPNMKKHKAYINASPQEYRIFHI